MRPFLLTLIVGFGLSCATPLKKPGSTTVDSAPKQTLSASVQVEAFVGSEGKVRLLRPQDDLTDGDRIALNISVDRPAYVYVAQISQAGVHTLLYENSPNAAQRPDLPLRLPDATSFYQINAQTEPSSLYIVASETPLSDPLFAKEKPKGEKPKDKQPPPDTTDLDKRALKMTMDGTLSGRGDPRGIVVLKFSLRKSTK